MTEPKDLHSVPGRSTVQRDIAPGNLGTVKQRHYDLALAEQTMRRTHGRYLSIEEILRRNGFSTGIRQGVQKKGAAQEDLTSQSLRLYVPAANQAAMGICLLELRDGTLKVAVGDRVDDTDLIRITNSLQRANREVLRVEIEPWDHECS